jgi:subtilisin
VIEGGDLTARILGGMEWAVTERVRVVSLSLGIRGYLTDFLGLIEVLRDSGYCLSSRSATRARAPADRQENYPRVLSVGYYTERDIVADDSSSQRFPRRAQPLVPDLVAPGDEVVSAAPGSGWRRLSGSSMAVPHVTGSRPCCWRPTLAPRSVNWSAQFNPQRSSARCCGIVLIAELSTPRGH